MDIQKSNTAGVTLITPGSAEEYHYAEKGYIIMDGRPICGICSVNYGDIHKNWCPYGPGAK